MLSLIKLLKLLLGLDKLARPKRLVLLCVTGHTQTPDCEFLRLFTCRQNVPFPGAFTRIQRAFLTDQESLNQRIFLEQLMGFEYKRQIRLPEVIVALGSIVQKLRNGLTRTLRWARQDRFN